LQESASVYLKTLTSVLSHRIVEEVSPRSGRKHFSLVQTTLVTVDDALRLRRAELAGKPAAFRKSGQQSRCEPQN